jgi:photosystem II stability/assembly factor-like uncharacterized protein
MRERAIGISPESSPAPYFAAAFLLLFAFSFLCGDSVLAQSDFRSTEQRGGTLLYKDSEQWIRERFRWFKEQRLLLDGIPDGAREEAWQQAQQMQVYTPQLPLSKSMQTSLGWSNIGPSNVGGRVTGIAIHPTNPDIVYFAAADGGIWKSTNAGAVFTPVTDDLPTMAMGAVAIDPNHPSTIWVGTGEANGSADSYPGIGVVLSTDAGAIWTTSGKPAGNIAKMLVDASRSSNILAATRSGLFRSNDSGSTWTNVLSGFVSDIVQHPVQRTVMFAGVKGSGLFKSNDSGNTWTPLATNVSGDSISRVGLDICRSNPLIIYSAIVSSRSSGLLCLLRSTDGGTTWYRINNKSTPNFFGSQGWYDIDIAVDPANPWHIIVGGVGIYASTDSGSTWKSISGIHVDHHAIEFAPSNPSIVYVGCDGGMYRSTNGGTSFVSLNNNLPITQFYELGVSLQYPNKMVGGTQDNGSKKRSNMSSVWATATGGDGGYAIIDYSDTNYVYTEYQNGSHNRSTDGGRTFSSINTGLFGSGPWVTPVAIHPSDSKVLFTCTNKQLYKTTNRGTQWFPYHGNMDSTSTINSIAIQTSDPRVMLVGYKNGKVWRTTDAGASWLSISSGLPSRTLTDIQFDPTKPQTYYCCYSGYSSTGVYKTTDAGNSWFAISGNLPAIPKNALAINPVDTSNLFVGTDFGVYSTTDGGKSWQILGSGMPKVVVVDLELHPSGVLRAATHGRSIYEMAVTVPVELAGLSAEWVDGCVRLHWRTLSETNNAGFAVERSIDEQSWRDVGYVEGKGSTMAVSEYAFTDGPLREGERIRYRLRQIDLDGTATASQEVELYRGPSSAGKGFEITGSYPSPGTTVVTVVCNVPHDAQVRLCLADASGRVVKDVADVLYTAGSHAVHIDVSKLPSGTYFCRLDADGVPRASKSISVIR